MALAFLDLVKCRPRSRAIGSSLLRTTPFIAAGVFALILYYLAQTPFAFHWERDPFLFLVFFLLCWTVFYAVSHQLPYTKDTVINDLLSASGRAFGEGYRVNLMRLVPHGDPFKSYFQITHSFKIEDPSIYHQEIKQDIPGAGEAFRDNKTIYVTGKRLRSDIDPYPKHLWSTPVLGRGRGQSGQPIAVLNVDCGCRNSLSDSKIESTKTSIEKIARLIEEYIELPV